MIQGLILQHLDPTSSQGYLVSPFQKSEEFTSRWWNPGQLLMAGDPEQRFSVVRTNDGVEVARVRIDADRDGPFQGYGVPSSLKDFVEIEFIEVAKNYRRLGYGRATVGLVLNQYPEVNLIAGSESDEFWEALSWKKYHHLEDPTHYRTLFVHWRE